MRSFRKPRFPKSPVSQRLRRYDAPHRVFVIFGITLVLLIELLATAPKFGELKTIQAAVDGAPPDGVQSSSWYCALVPATKADPEAGSVTVVNPNDAVVTGIATIVPTVGEARDTPISVTRNGKLVIRPGAVVDAPYAGVALRFEGGGVVVEHSARLSGGFSTAPCVTNGSRTWHLADGTTQVDTSYKLALFNPYDEDAIVDCAFPTDIDIEPARPPALNGLVVKARGIAVVEIGESLHRRDWIAATVTTKSGRVVVDQLQAGILLGAKGLALTPAAPEALSRWYVPDMYVDSGQKSRISIYNPADTETVARITVVNDGDVDPFTLHVPARSRVFQDFPAERLPKEKSGVQFSAVVDVEDGGRPVVVQMTSANTPPAEPVSSWSKLAIARPGTYLILGVNQTTDATEDWIRVVNVGKSPATVKMRAITEDGTVVELPTADLSPMRRTLLHLDEKVPSGQSYVVIDSNQPIVASRVLVSPKLGLDFETALALRR